MINHKPAITQEIQELPESFIEDVLDCQSIQSSYQLEECVRQDMLKSKVLLSKETLDFERRARRLYRADPVLGSAFIEAMYQTQDTWISFRDQSCRLEAFQIEAQTPAFDTTVNYCIIRMNAERIRELQALIK